MELRDIGISLQELEHRVVKLEANNKSQASIIVKLHSVLTGFSLDIMQTLRAAITPKETPKE